MLLKLRVHSLFFFFVIINKNVVTTSTCLTLFFTLRVIYLFKLYACIDGLNAIDIL